MRITIRILAVMLSLGLSLVLIELYLRAAVTSIVRRDVAGKGKMLEMNPEFLVEQEAGVRRLVPHADVIIKNHYLSNKDVIVQTNSLGFRSPELKSKTESEKRVLILGDSITLSEYLPVEETFPALTQQALQEKQPAHHWQVINSGVTNIGTEEEILTLKTRGLKTQPDIVVLAFYLNDSRPPWGFAGELGDRGWLRKHSLLYETLYTRIYQAQWLKQEQQKMRFEWITKQKELPWKTDPAALAQLAQAARYDWGSAWDDNSWQKITPYVEQFKKLSEGNFKPVIMIFPVRFQVEADYLENAPQKKLLELAEQLNIETLDTLPALRKHSEKKLYVDHCHFDLEGQRIIAKTLSDFLLR